MLIANAVSVPTLDQVGAIKHPPPHPTPPEHHHPHPQFPDVWAYGVYNGQSGRWRHAPLRGRSGEVLASEDQSNRPGGDVLWKEIGTNYQPWGIVANEGHNGGHKSQCKIHLLKSVGVTINDDIVAGRTTR